MYRESVPIPTGFSETCQPTISVEMTGCDVIQFNPLWSGFSPIQDWLEPMKKIEPVGETATIVDEMYFYWVIRSQIWWKEFQLGFIRCTHNVRSQHLSQINQLYILKE